MQRVGIAVSHALLFLAASLLLASWGMFPVKAAAQEISSQTAQVVPPGGTGCPSLSATAFTPYIYENEIHSFEFSIPDASYVAVAGVAGNTSIPFNQFTRSVDASGALRIHADIASTPVTGTLPLKVTLLSARGAGQPVCLSIVSMSIGPGPVQITQPTQPSAQTPSDTSTYAPPKNTVSKAPAPYAGTSVETPTTSAGTIVGTASRTAASVTPAFVSSLRGFLQETCSTPENARRLWLGLLLVYIVAVGVALWAEFPMTIPSMRTPERVAAAILILLLVLLGFWYFSAACRTALWMPLAAVLIAVLGLLAAYRNHPRMTQLLLIRDTKTPL